MTDRLGEKELHDYFSRAPTGNFGSGPPQSGHSCRFGSRPVRGRCLRTAYDLRRQR
jgi:hypothetical protein